MSEPRRLAELEEARGLLECVSCRDGYALASFKWGSVALPGELREMLGGMARRNIAILRLENRYLVRDLESEDAAR